MKRRIGIGMLGTTLDNVVKGDRWKRWRPTIAACSQPDFVFDRYEIIYPIHFKRLLDQVVVDLKVVSPKTEIVLHQLEMANPWDFEEVFAKLHDFMNRYSFDLEREEYFVNITTGTHVAQICLFLLAESRYLPGRLFQVGLVKGGDPRGTYSVIDLDLKKYNPIAARFEKEKDQSEQFLKAGIVTRNSSFNILIDQIETICLRSRDPLLLMGRTGVGKTELARRIFQLKKAKHKILGRFVEVNCATLKGDAVMSMLFGHVKGAFTGALKERNGLLKEADGGLIFLDEIGELGLDEQAMLLRAIEDKKFLPMGTDRDVSSDFELIAGTNRDLNADVQNGRFREDLLARINLWSFRLPDLKERREDIEPNLEFELTKFSTKTGKKLRFNQEALAAFLKFAHAPSTPWRGNFRDLNSAITRMGTFAESGRISLDLVETEIIRMQATWQKGSDSESERTVNGESGRGVAYHRVAALLADRVKDFDSFDLAQLEAVLETCAACSSLSEASRKLFAVSRLKKVSANDADRLTKYLQRFGLVAKDVVGVRSPAQSISF